MQEKTMNAIEEIVVSGITMFLLASFFFGGAIFFIAKEQIFFVLCMFLGLFSVLLRDIYLLRIYAKRHKK